MTNLSRRVFLAGLSTIPFAVWFQKYGLAQATLTRYDAYSANGKSMLKIYADAVNTMMKKTKEGDPKSWVFQWYTHWVKGDAKDSEINRIYGAGSSPQKDLAREMWDTCQAHGDGMDENFFLPWHRMYVYFFERIIRKVSGQPTFTLPYWNYSTSDTKTHGVIPPEFRMKGDPAFGSLFIDIRNVHAPSNTFADVNAGEPIDKYRTTNPLSTSSLAQCTYKPVPPAVPGFCQNLDSPLHGNIHVLVGNRDNMGNIPTAPGDPVFWTHHCNIDRLWASWNKGERKNPTDDPQWMGQQFIFADENGNRVVAKVQDFLDINKLGYTYENFEPVPPPNPPCPGIGAAAPRRHAIVPQGRVTLGSEPVRATLEVTPGAGAAAASDTLANRVKSLRPGRRLYVVVKDLRAQAQPGVLYDIYFDMPANTPPNKRSTYFIGTINFFDAHHVGHGAGPTAASAPPKFVSFDVTDVAKRLQRGRRLSAKPALTIIPDGPPSAQASPVVGEITLDEQ